MHVHFTFASCECSHCTCCIHKQHTLSYLATESNRFHPYLPKNSMDICYISHLLYLTSLPETIIKNLSKQGRLNSFPSADCFSVMDSQPLFAAPPTTGDA